MMCILLFVESFPGASSCTIFLEFLSGHCAILYIYFSTLPTVQSISISVPTAPDYAPGPQPGLETSSPSPYSSPPALTTSGQAPTPSYLAPVPVLAPSPNGFSPQQAPAPTPDLLSGGPSTTNSSADAKWCAVRDEFEDCLTYTSQLSSPNLSWTCLLRESKGECMEAIQTGLANLMSLEAGLAYVAFLNHSMKAILAEEYTFHSQSYGAVAVVNKKMCDGNSNLKLSDLKHHRSCHSGYLSAAGWNYPVQALLNSVPVDSELLDDESLPNDVKVISSFFSASCAPSEVREGGICTGCGTGDNSSFCSSTYNQYTGEDGAFRCLMDGRGDIAFLRAETPTLYSSDGLNNQTWSTKPVDEFMYLCPSGGCKSVNDNHGSCQFANVPANVIMTQNSLPETLKQAIITTLLAANWTESLYTGRNWQNYLLSVSTQDLAPIMQLTRQYLGTSAQVSQTIMDLDSNPIQTTSIMSFAIQSSAPAYFVSIAAGAVATALFDCL